MVWFKVFAFIVHVSRDIRTYLRRPILVFFLHRPYKFLLFIPRARTQWLRTYVRTAYLVGTWKMFFTCRCTVHQASCGHLQVCRVLHVPSLGTVHQATSGPTAMVIICITIPATFLRAGALVITHQWSAVELELMHVTYGERRDSSGHAEA
jgi:hypothetical protein